MEASAKFIKNALAYLVSTSLTNEINGLYDVQHYNKYNATLSITTLNANWRYAECRKQVHYADGHYVHCHYNECHYAQRHLY